jgi:sporulation protein YlmC with PRC-barrel domain
LYGKELLEKEVFWTDGWKIGKSKELTIDQNGWTVTHLEVELGSNIEMELGMSTTRLSHNRLPIPMSAVRGVGDVITLRATKAEIVSTIVSYSREIQGTKAQSNPGNTGIPPAA